MVLIPVAHAQLILKRFSKGQCMKASPDRIKARAQELRTEGYKVRASLDMNAGATRSQARPAQGKEHPPLGLTTAGFQHGDAEQISNTEKIAQLVLGN